VGCGIGCLLPGTARRRGG
ncbi:hypothetical protein A2U01_0111190, partial [Trifolium medium]|nr:hypothetical protein [Trifolium medium]